CSAPRSPGSGTTRSAPLPPPALPPPAPPSPTAGGSAPALTRRRRRAVRPVLSFLPLLSLVGSWTKNCSFLVICGVSFAHFAFWVFFIVQSSRRRLSRRRMLLQSITRRRISIY